MRSCGVGNAVDIAFSWDSLRALIALLNRLTQIGWTSALKARPKSRLGSSQKQRNRKHSAIRSRVEHLFRVIKCQFGYTKVRNKGLAKNAA